MSNLPRCLSAAASERFLPDGAQRISEESFNGSKPFVFIRPYNLALLFCLPKYYSCCLLPIFRRHGRICLRQMIIHPFERRAHKGSSTLRNIDYFCSRFYTIHSPSTACTRVCRIRQSRSITILVRFCLDILFFLYNIW